MKEITIEKMQELESNPEFVTELKAATNVSEVAIVLKRYGIEFTEEEIQKGCAQAKGILKDLGYLDSDEISPETLGMVSGGVNAAVYGVGLLMAAGIAVSPWLWAGGLVVMTCGIFMKG